LSPGSAAFSVVIPTYRRRASLEKVLHGLAGQQWPPDLLEAIVVSDGADDGSAEVVRSFPAPFPLYLLEQANQGPAAARNLGLASARGPFVLFLDDDVVPSPRLVAEHASAHGGAGDRVVMGTMLEPPGHLLPWVRWESRTLADQYAAMVAGLWKPTPWQFYTGNASLRLEHLRRAGGFDPRFRRAEDVELGFRLERIGLEFSFAPGAAATHIAERGFGSWLASAYQYGRTDILFGKGEERGAVEFRKRHPLTRRLVLWGLRHPSAARRLAGPAERAIRAADGLGRRHLAHQLCSAIFNLQYWLGVSDQLGSGAQALRLAGAGSRAGLLSRTRTGLPIGGRSHRS
jgi:glycosyltransferase involved in cell wall biosynthesis